MIRKLLLPAIAAALLSGCVSYGYRDGRGDYYYSQPGTEYRYYGGYGYGYPGYYGYYGGLYGYGSPYWRGYYRYRVPIRPGHGGGHHDGDHGDHHHDGDHHPPTGGDRQQRPRAPWRDLGGMTRPSPARRGTEATQGPPPPSVAPRVAPQQRAAPVRSRTHVPRSGGNGKRDRGLSPAR